MEICGVLLDGIQLLRPNLLFSVILSSFLKTLN